MKEFGFKTPDANLSDLGLSAYKAAYWNLSPDELVKHTLDKEMGTLSDKGALVIKTGKFTGRSPKRRSNIWSLEVVNLLCVRVTGAFFAASYARKSQSSLHRIP